jgi:hypothetical protein
VRRILDQHEAVPSLQLEDRIEVDRMAGEVHDDDGPGARGDRCGELHRIDVEGLGIDVGQDRRGADMHRGIGRGGEGDGRGDDLVARADAVGDQGEMERRGAR